MVSLRLDGREDKPPELSKSVYIMYDNGVCVCVCVGVYLHTSG